MEGGEGEGGDKGAEMVARASICMGKIGKEEGGLNKTEKGGGVPNQKDGCHVT